MKEGDVNGSTVGETNAIGVSDTNKAFSAILPDISKMETFLGEYLFRGMSMTHMRRQEEDSGLRRTTHAVRLYPANRQGDDFKLEVMLSFNTGREMWAKVFPH